MAMQQDMMGGDQGGDASAPSDPAALVSEIQSKVDQLMGMIGKSGLGDSDKKEIMSSAQAFMSSLDDLSSPDDSESGPGEADSGVAPAVAGAAKVKPAM